MKIFFLTLSLVGASILICKAGSKAGIEQTDAERKAPAYSLEGREELIKFFLQEKPFEFHQAYRVQQEGC